MRKLFHLPALKRAPLINVLSARLIHSAVGASAKPSLLALVEILHPMPRVHMHASAPVSPKRTSRASCSSQEDGLAQAAAWVVQVLTAMHHLRLEVHSLWGRHNAKPRHLLCRIAAEQAAWSCSHCYPSPAGRGPISDHHYFGALWREDPFHWKARWDSLYALGLFPRHSARAARRPQNKHPERKKCTEQQGLAHSVCKNFPSGCSND
mmetsp:Transcript_46738/g.72856  ORF Transcript_46738/g.72856 Transcript_46738/m.72856 type:complete len:208 (+) Transcript_46738:472-1095(+)